MEELTEVQDYGLKDEHEFSNNTSCLSMVKQQSTNPLTEQASNDQVMELAVATPEIFIRVVKNTRI